MLLGGGWVADNTTRVGEGGGQRKASWRQTTRQEGGAGQFKASGLWTTERHNKWVGPHVVIGGSSGDGYGESGGGSWSLEFGGAPLLMPGMVTMAMVPASRGVDDANRRWWDLAARQMLASIRKCKKMWSKTCLSFSTPVLTSPLMQPPQPQIIFESRLGAHNVGNNSMMSVDGTDICIPQKGVTKKGNLFASHKYVGKSALRYELSVDILTGNLVWILKNLMSKTVRVLGNSPGTRSGTESLPGVFLHNTFEQIHYYYNFCLS